MARQILRRRPLAHPALPASTLRSLADFSGFRRALMLKFTRAWKSAATRVFTARRAPDAGHFRTATARLATAGLHFGDGKFFDFRPHRSFGPAEAARESHPLETDWPR